MHPEPDKKGPAENALSWDSPRMRGWLATAEEGMNAWLRSPGNSLAIKEAAGKPLNLLVSVLDAHLSERELLELAQSCRTMRNAHGGWRDGCREIAQAIVFLSCEREHREALVAALANACPVMMPNGTDIELYVALAGPEPDPILILADAFDQSAIAAVRWEIAMAFRRGFTPIGIGAEDDAEFVRKCREWYDENRGKVELVTEYGHGREYVVPLFVPKGTVLPAGLGWGPKGEAGSGPRSSFDIDVSRPSDGP